MSCYEAGRDGFWIHRALEQQGIENIVVDSASIEVNRRQRRTKTDQVDVKGLLRLLQRYIGGERGMLSVVKVPSVEEEDDRRLHRERERLIKERGSHSARIQSLLVAHGIRLPIDSELVARLETVTGGMGYPLGADLKAEIAREYERYRLVDEQIRSLAREQRERAKAGSSVAMGQVNKLMELKAVGWQSSWIPVMDKIAGSDFEQPKAGPAGVNPKDGVNSFLPGGPSRTRGNWGPVRA